MAKKSKYEWTLKPIFSDEALKQLQSQTGISSIMATLCLQRGMDTKEKYDQFIHPSLEQLHSPYDMYDMEKGVKRIKQAIENGESILIYGDYDADGITSTTILHETIESLGGNVIYYLPNRFTDGYGPNRSVFEYMIDQEGIQLIVTCDNGVAGHEAIQFAQDKGIDVIVSDHHELPSELPNAYAIIHPRHPKGNYPFGELSGAGVAFKLATALLEDIPVDLLEVVAIGTIADLVPLIDENRVLVYYGLEQLKQTQRIGLMKLIETSGMIASDMTSESVAFSIAPRLNAIGRLDDATPGVALLTTFDDEEAQQICNAIQQKNNERKDIVKHIVDDVLNCLEKPYPPVIILANEQWHAGVLGIVASQIVELTNRPTILLQIDKQTHLAKGSGRSVQGINLFEHLSHVKEYLHAFGGHDMAAGMTISVDNITVVRDVLYQRVPVLDKKEVQADMRLLPSMVTLDLLHELKQFEPFGNGNDKPTFIIESSQLNAVKSIGANNQHVKGQIDQLDFIQFNASVDVPHLKVGTTVQFLAQLRLNEWNGIEKAQLHVLDSKIEGIQLFDCRSSKLKKSDLQIENATYVFFQEKLYHFFKTKLPQSSDSVFAQQISDILSIDNVVLFDMPMTIDALDSVLSLIEAENIYMMFHTSENAYLLGLPTREQFAQLFKILYSQKQLDLKKHLDTLAKQLNVKKDLIILMFQVFFEVKFVTIESGVATLQDTINKVDLMATQTMLNQQQKIVAEKQLLFTDYNILSQYIKKRCYKKENV